MNILAIRSRIETLIHTHSSVFARAILNSGFSCVRCGWCCRHNFNIRITQHILRPFNAISIFPYFANLRMLSHDYSGDILVCDGETIPRFVIS